MILSAITKLPFDSGLWSLIFGLCTLEGECPFYSKHKDQRTKTKVQLRKYPAHARRFRHAINCQDVSARSHVRIELLRFLVD